MLEPGDGQSLFIVEVVVSRSRLFEDGDPELFIMNWILEFAEAIHCVKSRN